MVDIFNPGTVTLCKFSMSEKNTLHRCKVSVSCYFYDYLFSSSVIPDLNSKISLLSKTVISFKQVQNKMHWAAHKHTAAEVIYERADAEKENMGLTSWEHNEIRRSDVEVAKNYLTEQELDALNKIVTAYLDIAEVHALNKEPMYMKDWLETIDDYLKMTRRDILTSSGHISHKQAIEKAHAEYDKYKNRLDDTLSPVEKDFIESIGMLEQITDSSKK